MIVSHIILFKWWDLFQQVLNYYFTTATEISSSKFSFLCKFKKKKIQFYWAKSVLHISSLAGLCSKMTVLASPSTDQNYVALPHGFSETSFCATSTWLMAHRMMHYLLWWSLTRRLLLGYIPGIKKDTHHPPLTWLDCCVSRLFTSVATAQNSTSPLHGDPTTTMVLNS